MTVTLENDKCVFLSNAIPNHDFNDASAHFATNASEQDQRYEITTSPVQSSASTGLTLGTDNAIFLNGVKLDLLAAGCYGVGNGSIGCNDMSQPWRYDPMLGEGGFGTDIHHAHVQPGGAYHYHGSPWALFDEDLEVESPVIGFSADGFPIFGSYFNDSGIIRKATSSYQLKQGDRTEVNGINPGGSYDGTFVDDYEYISDLGDLDECNGMSINGSYGYYVTESYPWVLGCFKGTPDTSFDKGGGGRP